MTIRVSENNVDLEQMKAFCEKNKDRYTLVIVNAEDWRNGK